MWAYYGMSGASGRRHRRRRPDREFGYYPGFGGPMGGYHDYEQDYMGRMDGFGPGMGGFGPRMGRSRRRPEDYGYENIQDAWEGIMDEQKYQEALRMFFNNDEGPERRAPSPSIPFPPPSPWKLKKPSAEEESGPSAWKNIEPSVDSKDGSKGNLGYINFLGLRQVGRGDDEVVSLWTPVQPAVTPLGRRRSSPRGRVTSPPVHRKLLDITLTAVVV